MRVIVASSLILMTTMACSESGGEEFRNSFRESAISGCVKEANGESSDGNPALAQELCTCIFDKYMDGKSNMELMTKQGELQDLGAKCVQEKMGSTSE